uniref:Uncharacterized protein n=1 Tax=Pipistrellus kuhlii TaxID=59472 RepID=A0A7J8A8D7_PIPKU|nr:hypothetical protein mPipKuh1_009007 [Pipistrellus kuhlii]
MTEWGYGVIRASCHSGGGGSTKEAIRRLWAPHKRFFAYRLESSWVSVALEPLLMWPRSLGQPQSAGSPVLEALASPLGLRSSPSSCIVSCFCISAHFSLTAPPLPLLALLQLGPPQKLSSRPSLDVTSPKVFPDTSYLPWWHLCRCFSYFLHPTSQLFRPMSAQLLKHQDCVLLAFVSQAGGFISEE